VPSRPSPTPPGPRISYCVHDRASVYDPMNYCAPDPFAPVQRMTLTIQTRDSTITLPIAPTADAIFLTMPAIDKFVIPYYTRIVGVEEAAAMRRGMVGRLAPR
jgi:hypothetical protein